MLPLLREARKVCKVSDDDGDDDDGDDDDVVELNCGRDLTPCCRCLVRPGKSAR